jgi:hypothetical protein
MDLTHGFTSSEGPGRLRQYFGTGMRAEARRLGLTRPRLIEIAVAVLLTLAAVLFVGLAIWATDEYEMRRTIANFSSPAR